MDNLFEKIKNQLSGTAEKWITNRYVMAVLVLALLVANWFDGSENKELENDDSSNT